MRLLATLVKAEMSKFSRFGARDSEPEAVLADILQKVYNKLLEMEIAQSEFKVEVCGNQSEMKADISMM